MSPARDDVLFEYDSAGASTGVELEIIEAIDEPFDPEQIDVVTRTPTVDLILSRIRTEMIDLAPDFQRRADIWHEKHQSRLIESLLLRIPLPTLYASEDKGDVWAIVDGIHGRCRFRGAASSTSGSWPRAPWTWRHGAGTARRPNGRPGRPPFSTSPDKGFF